MNAGRLFDVVQNVRTPEKDIRSIAQKLGLNPHGNIVDIQRSLLLNLEAMDPNAEVLVQDFYTEWLGQAEVVFPVQQDRVVSQPTSERDDVLGQIQELIDARYEDRQQRILAQDKLNKRLEAIETRPTAQKQAIQPATAYSVSGDKKKGLFEKFRKDWRL